MKGIYQVGLMEVEDRSASDYVVSNYNEMVRTARKMGVAESRCNDIVHDVYISLLRSEECGNGYDMNRAQYTDIITLDKFVYGRMKKFSLNRKYRDGYKYEEISASADSSDISDLEDAQIALNAAKSYDDIEFIESKLSIKDDLEYLLSFESEMSVSIKFILKNLGRLANKSFDRSLIAEVRKMIESDEDFADAMKSLIRLHSEDSAAYEVLVSNI